MACSSNFLESSWQCRSIFYKPTFSKTWRPTSAMGWQRTEIWWNAISTKNLVHSCSTYCLMVFFDNEYLQFCRETIALYTHGFDLFSFLVSRSSLCPERTAITDSDGRKKERKLKARTSSRSDGRSLPLWSCEKMVLPENQLSTGWATSHSCCAVRHAMSGLRSEDVFQRFWANGRSPRM